VDAVLRQLELLHPGAAGRQDAVVQSRDVRQTEAAIRVRPYRLVRHIRRAWCAWGAWDVGLRLGDIALVRRSRCVADSCQDRRLPCGRRSACRAWGQRLRFQYWPGVRWAPRSAPCTPGAARFAASRRGAPAELEWVKECACVLQCGVYSAPLRLGVEVLARQPAQLQPVRRRAVRQLPRPRWLRARVRAPVQARAPLPQLLAVRLRALPSEPQRAALPRLGWGAAEQRAF